jgi:hypothetical protein
MDLKETEYKYVGSINLAQNRVQWWSFVDKVMNLLVAKELGIR